MSMILYEYRRIALFIALCLCLCQLSLAQKLLNGIVRAEPGGEALAGATVLVKGTSQGVFTDAQGRFSLSVQESDSLLISFIGYKPQSFAVAGITTLEVLLEQGTNMLSEVVVTGYGKTALRDLTGSVVSVSERSFNKGNMVTAENLLNGRAAGLTVNTGGAPGSGSTIRIRGGASLDASNDPLIVINGLPVSNNAIGGARSILSTINPNDIESFTVLKDASATAIYGSRASNGVILITTKSGAQGLQVQFSAQGGYSQVAKTVEVFEGDAFRALVERERPELAPLLGDANTNWQDEIYRETFFQTYNLSAQGSLFKKVPVRVSAGITDQPGLRLTSNFRRNSASLSLTPKLFKDQLEVAFNANYSQEQNRFAEGQEGNAITFDPTQPVQDPASPFGGYFQYWNDNQDGVLNSSDLTPNAPGNPVAALLQRDDQSRVNRLYGNFKLTYHLPFIPQLSLVANLGLDDASATGYTRIDSNGIVAQPNGELVGSHTEYTNDQRNVLFDGYATYKEEWGGLKLDVTGGYSFQRFEETGFFSGELRNDLPDSEPVVTVENDLILIGLFARTNLSLKDKYLLTLSYRRDATSRFSPDNRWGNFPAAAFAWRINEDLFPDVKQITNLKLRLGWGITGQQDIGNEASLQFLQRYATGLPSSQYVFGGQPIPIAIPEFRNEELKWEETTTYNAGLDFGFFRDRITGTVEVFYKESRDLLAFAAISDGSNFSNSGFQNIGNFTSEGLEFSLNADIISSEVHKLRWNVSVNTTLIRTRIQELALGQDVRVGDISGGVGNTIQLHRVGYAPYKFFVYRQVYGENGLPIEGAYVDLNGDNIINDEDRYLYRNNQPEATIGFQTQLTYHNWDLGLNLRASLGNYLYNNVNSARAQLDLIQNVQVLANLPSSVEASQFQTTSTVILSDYYMENGSFLRLDNVNLGYSLQNLFGTKLQGRIGLGGQNLWVLTNYSGIDPEIFSGIDNTLYPRARTFLFSLNLTY